jgi:myo-inositol 2-dehydrogenase / D-chiro-inositol 1-dehydrogenase
MRQKSGPQVQSSEQVVKDIRRATCKHYPSDWRPRFVDAYRQQNRTWIKTINTGKGNLGASTWDGYCSTAVAGIEALHSGKPTLVKQIAKPAFYEV